MRSSDATGRSAFTLVEITMVMTLLAIIGALVMPFFLKQSRMVTNTAGYLDAQQSVSFALNMVDHDLRIAGVGTARNQPTLVEANPLAITFNGDLVTKDTGSVTAASYYDPNVPDSVAASLTPGSRITLPLSSTQYPDSTYYQTPGVASAAETISYYLRVDSSVVSVPPTYILWRRVNNSTPILLARGLVVPPSGIAFRYFIPGAAPNSVQELTVAAGQLPLYFTEPQGPANGPDTMLAKVSEVRMQLSAMFQDRAGHQSQRSASEVIPLLNAGLAHIAACGSPPQPAATFTATAFAVGDSVDLSWTPSPDESGGTKDVQSYVVYRRKQPSLVWQALYTVQTAGIPTYDEHDRGLAGAGAKYDYAVAAQDCTPALSTLTQQTGVSPLP